MSCPVSGSATNATSSGARRRTSWASRSARWPRPPRRYSCRAPSARRDYGIVTLAVQLAFVGSTATRFGMDVANIRLVAILMGKGEGGRVRGLVRRASLIALSVSVLAGVVVFLASGALAEGLTELPDVAQPAFMAAALALPLAAMTQIYLGATRGLKIMRHTLYVQWIGQPLSWIALTLAFWVGGPDRGGDGARVRDVVVRRARGGVHGVGTGEQATRRRRRGGRHP